MTKWNDGDRDGQQGKDDDNSHQHLTATSSCSQGGNEQVTQQRWGEATMTKGKGSHANKNNRTGQDHTNTNNKGADNNDDNGDQGKTNNEEDDVDEAG